MERWLNQFSDNIYSVMRIIVGLMFACHGAQKLFGVLGGKVEISTTVMFFAAIIEFVGGGLIALGFLTSYAAFLASGQMAFAYFMAHAPHSFFPIVNKGELAVLYCFIFLYIAARGSGKLSLDQIIGKKTGNESLS